MATPDLKQLMQQAQKMQEKMQEAQQELEKMTVTGVAGAGLVSVTMTGRHNVTKVDLDEDLMDEDISMIEDLLAAAVNDAVNKIEKETRGKMQNLTAGMNLPSDLSGAG